MRRVLTINGGSSSIKFALFEQVGLLKRSLTGVTVRVILTDEEVTIARETLATLGGPIDSKTGETDEGLLT